MRPKLRVAPLSLLLIATLLAGCGGDSGGKAPSQVAVKVNKAEITVHQLNEMLSRAGNVPAEQMAQASSAALERLIDQELLVQQAVERKLDRDPRVLQSIDMARREILARAYAEQAVGAPERPGDAEIAAFYTEHPELFAQRRVFNLQEVNVRLPAERFEELRTQLAAVGSIRNLTDWLTAQNIPFTANAGVRPAEQLPMELLKGLQRMEAGQVAVSRTPTGALLIFVAGVREEPIDQARARPFIEQFIANKARTDRAAAEIKRLREAAAIEYVGDFSAPASAAAPAASADAAPAAAAPAAAPATPPGGEPSVFERGAATLR